MTKNNAMAIILSVRVICMTCSSYCWVSVSHIRYFEFRDLIVSSMVNVFLSEKAVNVTMCNENKRNVVAIIRTFMYL